MVLADLVFTNRFLAPLPASPILNVQKAKSVFNCGTGLRRDVYALSFLINELVADNERDQLEGCSTRTIGRSANLFTIHRSAWLGTR
jgi:hypothetical protein